MKSAYLTLLLLLNLPGSEAFNHVECRKPRAVARHRHAAVVEQPSGDVQKMLQELISHDDLATAGIGFYALNLETGEIIADYNSRKSLTPASTMKIVTTATALMLAGPQHRFVTRLGFTGQVSTDGILQGDLVITADGDPTLGSGNFYKNRTAFLEAWAAKIRELGITKITGSVVADISIFKPQVPFTWIWGDMGSYYGAQAHPLSIYDNEFYASFKSCGAGQNPQLVALVPDIPGIKFKMDVVPAGEGENALFAGSPYENERVITGTLPPNQKNYTLQGSIPNPGLLVAEILEKKLADAGIAVEGTAKVSSDRIEAVTVDSVMSPTLEEIITVTNVKSMNTYAESLLLHTALWQGRFPDPVTAGKNVIRFWGKRGVDINGMFMDDGSGLSRSDGVSARNLVGILSEMYRSPYCSDFMHSLPVAGHNGSVASIGTGTRTANNMAAKSGYMTRVRSYAGYVKNRKDETIAFAILVNNYTGSPHQTKAEMARLMMSLAEVQ